MDLHKKLADTYYKSLNVYLLAIEEMIGLVKTEKEIKQMKSLAKTSTSFTDGNEDLIVARDIERNGETKCYDIMNLCTIKSLIPELAKLGKSQTFKSSDSEEDLILKRQIEIIHYSNSIVKYDRVKYLDFSHIDWDTKRIADLMEQLIYRDTTLELLKSDGIKEFINNLDKQKEKDTVKNLYQGRLLM